MSLRSTVLLFISVLAIKKISAQTNLPGNSTSLPAATHQARVVPAAYDINIPLNYIRVWEPQMPMADETDVVSIGHTVEEVHRTLQYFDGLGRPVQTVAWQQSGDKRDMDRQWNMMSLEESSINTCFLLLQKYR